MGFDKARLQDENGKYLLAQNAKKLGDVFATVALVAAAQQSFEGLPALEGFALWRDHYAETGPLGGLCTALEEAQTPWVFAMACDMPQPNMALAQHLYALLGDAQVGLFVREGRMEPLFAFYHKSCLAVFQSQLAAGRLRLRAGFDELRVRAVPLPCENDGENGPQNAAMEAAFLNLNTPEDLAGWLGGQRGEKPGLPCVPNMLMIGSFARNSGKTTLAAALIERWKNTWPVIGLKVVSIGEGGGKCHRGAAGCGLCTAFAEEFALEEEFGDETGKDTARLLQAGAKRVFLLKSKKEALPQAFAAFLRQAPAGALVVCESNSLRGALQPGVFLMVGENALSGVGKGIGPEQAIATPAAGRLGGKASAKAVAQLADALVSPQGDGTFERVLQRINVQKMPDGELRVCWDDVGAAAKPGTQEGMP